ncbi:MAG: glycosyltransferase, partial [Actinobacteria bacterium]|nr:glycosyltransferase [Actinomycetota bacterium]
MDIFLLYQYIITVILLFILVNFLINNILFKDTSRFKLPESVLAQNPLMSILIPARNEEKNIKRCIISLTKQDYKNIEILVLDDNSTDDTARIVLELSQKDPRIKLYSGEPLKKGWLGKSYACWQLSKHARGDYLIFTDADTLHFPNSISGAVACLLKYNLDALSVFPKEIMVTFHERMMVPFGHYIILSLMPLYLIRKIKTALFCTAIGQFMLFKKEVYKKIGGHKSIKGKMLEDIKISKRVKSFGYKFMIFDGRSNVYCRMYRNFREIVEGYSKVLFAVFDYKIYMISIAIILVAAIFLFPFLMLPIGILFDWSLVLIELIILQIIIILITKTILSLRFKCKAVDIILHPISMIYLILIAINSVFNAKIGMGVYWKGRIYDVSKEDELRLVSDNY